MNTDTEDESLETGVRFVEEPPEDLVPRRGSEVVLNCSAWTSADFPAANVTWRRNGRAVTGGGNDLRRVRMRSSGVDSSLSIRRVQARTDNGHYQCVAAVRGLGVLLSRPTRLTVAGALTSLCDLWENASQHDSRFSSSLGFWR